MYSFTFAFLGYISSDLVRNTVMSNGMATLLWVGVLLGEYVYLLLASVPLPVHSLGMRLQILVHVHVQVLTNHYNQQVKRCSLNHSH